MNNTGHTRDPREIEAELDRTRAQMSHTLDELQHKFSPGELFDQALSYMRSSNDGDLALSLKHTITRNPLAVTLVGIGLAWLALSGRRDDSQISPLMGPYGDMEGGYQDPLHSQAQDPHVLGGIGGGVSGPSDEVAEDLDQASPSSDEAGPAVYGGGRSSISGPSDEVAEDLDEASPNSDQTGRTTPGVRSTV